MRRTRSKRLSAVAVAVAALAAAALGGNALAGHLSSGVKSYTGCLTTSGGTLTLIKEGNAPQKACPSGSVEAHFSGGDITSIAAGTGVQVTNGTNGAATLALDPQYGLRQDCSAGQVVKWNGSAWACAADEDTTYSEGTGLDLSSGNAFSIEPGYRLPGKACTTAGQFATGFSSSGEIQCAAQSTGVAVWKKSAGSMALPKGEGVDVITMPLQAGTYLVTAVATIRDGGGDFRDEEVSVECLLRDGAFATLPVQESQVDIGEETKGDGPSGNAVVHGAVSLQSADSVRFTCTSSGGDGEPDQAFTSTMTAIQIGALHSP